MSRRTRRIFAHKFWRSAKSTCTRYIDSLKLYHCCGYYHVLNIEKKLFTSRYPLVLLLISVFHSIVFFRFHLQFLVYHPYDQWHTTILLWVTTTALNQLCFDGEIRTLTRPRHSSTARNQWDSRSILATLLSSLLCWLCSSQYVMTRCLRRAVALVELTWSLE